MMVGVSESLAGRVAVLQMHSLSNNEINDFKSIPFTTNINNLFEISKDRESESLEEVYLKIFNGSMPALFHEDFDREFFYGSYVNTYLQCDFKNKTINELDFFKFMGAIAARTATVLNYADISKDLGISAPTIKQWISILITSQIITLVEPYSNNQLQRAIKAPKVYFLDTGLCTYLTRWDSYRTLEVSTMNDAILETYVVSEIIKSYNSHGKRAPIFYYRDKDGKEIDLLLEYNNTLYPIEIKKTAHPRKDDIKHFKVLENSTKPIGTGLVISMVKEIIPIDNNNYAIGIWLI